MDHGRTLAGQATVGVPGSRQPRPPAAARIPPLPEAEWTAEQRALVAKAAPKGDADSALRTLVRVPALVQGVMPYTTYLTTDSTLPPRVRHLLILRTAWLCGNDVLWSRYASGLTADERRRVAQGPSAAGWSDADKALLRTADELFRLSSLSAATWGVISSAYDLHGRHGHRRDREPLHGAGALVQLDWRPGRRDATRSGCLATCLT